LLFESAYTRSLIELGQIDTFSRREEVLQFFEVSASSKIVYKKQIQPADSP
jgi:hypothetical protein